jgi:hypothetical protein
VFVWRVFNGYLHRVQRLLGLLLGHRATIALTASAAAVVLGPACQAQLRVCAYNITNMVGDNNALRECFRAAHLDDKTGFAIPVGLFIFGEVKASGLSSLTAAVNATAPVGYTYALATFTTSGTEDGASGAQAAYYRTDLLAELTAGHMDIPTGASRNTDRWQFRLQGYDSTAARFYVYGAHLKASTGAANVAERLNGVLAIRANADALGAGIHTLYTGDMNFYVNTEDGYQAFLDPGNGQAWDPLGTGTWGGTSNGFKHTQSPRDITAGGLVGGGLDDRFDFILPTSEFNDNDGLSFIANTYRALGNDGGHYNLAINAGNNSYYPSDIPRSNTLADNLFAATDHIPLIADFRIPARNQAVLVAPPARVIQNASGIVAQVRVSNGAVGLAVGVDPLDYTVSGSSVLSGVFSGTAPQAPSYSTVNLAVSTSIIGLRTGNALATTSNEAAQTPSITLPVSLRVLRVSNPSLSASQDLNAELFTASASVGGPVVDVPVSVNNFGYYADQALMDVDSASVVAAGFSVVGVSGTSVGSGSGSVTVRFNPAGFGAGTYEAPVSIFTSDENVPGQSSASVTATVRMTVGTTCVAADFNCDGLVDGADLGQLLAQWGQPGVTDLNGDGITDGADLGMLLSLWG